MALQIKIALFLIGAISGLAIMLTGATLNFCLAKSGVSKAEIGMFALVALPYSINFIWTPILDKYKPPLIGKIVSSRIGWIILLQLLLAMAIFTLGSVLETQNMFSIAWISLLVAFLSSTNDSVMGALRSEMLPVQNQGPASGIYVIGYRLGMMLGGSGSIYLSFLFTWGEIYQIIAGAFVIFPILLALLLDPYANKPSSYTYDANDQPQGVSFKSIGCNYKFTAQILILLILYRLGDNFINTMINPFLLELKFTDFDIATTGKLCSSISTICGGILGGYFMKKYNIIDSLLYFGAIHAFIHLLLAILATVGNNLTLYFFTNLCESITAGMAMTAYIAFITSVCKGKYKSTKQALFTSMMGVSRSIFPSVSGIIASWCGWTNFFILAFLLSIPALVLLKQMRKALINYIYQT